MLHLLNIITSIIRNFDISFAYCIHCIDYVTYNKAIYNTWVILFVWNRYSKLIVPDQCTRRPHTMKVALELVPV